METKYINTIYNSVLKKISFLTNYKIQLTTIFLLILFFCLRIPNLGIDISHTDEARWHIRSENFLKALQHKDFLNTYQHNQPGVMLMWVGAAYEYIFHSNFINPVNFTNLTNVDTYLTVSKESKTLLIVVLGVLFLFHLQLIKKLTNYTVMFLYGLLASVEPYLVGVDRYFHVTSLETYLLFASFLSLWLWYKNNKKVSLIFSALLFSMSLLTKIASVILLPLYVFVFLLKLKENKSFDTKSILKDSIIFLTILLATYILLFPAILINPVLVFSKLYAGIYGGISEDARSILYNGLFSVLYYPVLFIFKASPVTLVLLLCTLFSLRKLKTILELKFLIIYILLYYIALSVSVKKIDRYLISLLPPILLLVSVTSAKFKLNIQKIIVSSTLLFTLFLIYVYHPVYSAYYSPFFGGSKIANRFNVYTNSGQYYAQAALYLNENVQGKKIYVPYSDISFYYLFKEKENMQYVTKKNADFVVLSFNKSTKDFVPKRCVYIEKSFGSKIENILTIYKCTENKL